MHVRTSFRRLFHLQLYVVTMKYVHVCVCVFSVTGSGHGSLTQLVVCWRPFGG
jgi:hypothetical protein